MSAPEQGLLGWQKLGLLYLPFLLLVTVPFGTGEEFPFSPFPMYNQWNPKTYLIYFEDREGEPIPIQVATTISAGRFRKMFDSQQRKIQQRLRDEGKKVSLWDFGPEEWRPCGVWLLDWMDRTCEPGRLDLLAEKRPLRVVRRVLRLEEGKIVHEDTVVATDEDREGWTKGGSP